MPTACFPYLDMIMLILHVSQMLTHTLANK